MRRFVGLILVVFSLALAIQSIRSRTILKANASGEDLNKPSPTSEMEFQQELVFQCPSGSPNLHFKLKNNLMYEVYDGDQKLSGADVWAANITDEVWNGSCTKFGFITGTASWGLYPEVVDIKQRKITMYDLHTEVLQKNNAIDHIYSENLVWHSGNILGFTAKGFIGGTNTTIVRFLVDTETSKITVQE